MFCWRFYMWLAAVALCLQPAASSAAWLRCVATGSDSHGPFAADTTVVNVGQVAPERIAYFKQRLRAAIAANTPEASLTDVNCTATEDQLAAASAYAKLFTKQSKTPGWDRLEIFVPDQWLADSDYRDGADAVP